MRVISGKARGRKLKYPKLPKSKRLRPLTGRAKEALFNILVNKIEGKVGAWVRGQLVLMLLVGVTTYIALLILGVPYALPLAIVAGLLKAIPVIGPIIAAIPAILVAFVHSAVLAIAVLALYILVEQITDNFISPLLMAKAVDLSPLVIIFALLVGGMLFGIVGALLAVPAAGIAQVIFEDYLKNRTEAS